MNINKKVNVEKKSVSCLHIFIEFFLLGLTSFGGPIAHIEIFRKKFSIQKNWIDKKSFIDVVSFSNFLPGPTSSQVGMCIGYLQQGISGSILAWIGFTLPSAIIMILFAYGYFYFNNNLNDGCLLGVKAVVVVIVSQAIISMSINYLNDFKKFLIAFSTLITLSFFQLYEYHFYVLIVSGFIGMFFFKDYKIKTFKRINIEFKSFIFIFLFFVLFLGLPIISNILEFKIINVLDKFYRSGSLVFGGGHVVLPLLKNEFIDNDLIDEQIFLFGYGLAQAIPGPLFTFSGFLGASIVTELSTFLTGVLSIIMIFLPSFFLVIGIMPYWDYLRSKKKIRLFLIGVNSCVVGLLMSAFYNPILLSSFNSINDIILITLGFIVIFLFKFPQWLSVIFLVLTGYVLNKIEFIF